LGHIGIRDLKIFAHHGVYPEETENGQTIYVSADLYTDTWEAEQRDELEASVNYGTACEVIAEVMTHENYKLIERAAAVVCETLMLRFPKLDKVCVKLDKPEAPIALPFGTVFVEVCREWKDVYIGIGSNMGDKEGQIKAAIEYLDETRGISVEKVSTLIRTEPYGYTEQDEFVNGCLKLRTWLPPERLLERLQEIERLLHRERKIHWGPRTIDLDILLYGDAQIHTKDLCVPHPDMANRRFVLEPLSEIAEWVWHPTEQKTINQMLEALNEKEVK
jgi:dihydroneopterin aldolase/2-amino-4-hydroxy-6-hydroxymethyldihydropteridine diphosphokinase